MTAMRQEHSSATEEYCIGTIVADFRDSDYLAQTETGARTRNSGAFTSTSIV